MESEASVVLNVHEPHQEISISHLSLESGRQYVGFPPGTGASEFREAVGRAAPFSLTWFQCIFSAPLGGRLRREMSGEQMDGCRFWTNSVHKCVSDSKAARSACAFGSSVDPDKEGGRSCLRLEDRGRQMRAATSCL